MTLTMKVSATAGSDGITLATNATPSTTDAELYLGLKVGDDITTIKVDEQTIMKTVAGTPDNFEIAVKDGEYVF